MDNREILRSISSESGPDSGDETVLRKLVLFFIEDKMYAVDSDEVVEVVIVSDIYPLPFVPEYVAGIINRHGEPYTVLDLKRIFGGEKLEASRVLIMNNADDQISFLISDIEKIVEIPETGLVSLPPSEESVLFSGSFLYEGSDIFIINPREIYERLNADLRNI